MDSDQHCVFSISGFHTGREQRNCETLKWGKTHAAPCAAFLLSSAVNHHVACWLRGRKIKKGERECEGRGGGEGGREGGGESVVQIQNTSGAKVAGMDELGGREKMRGTNRLLNVISSMNGR